MNFKLNMVERSFVQSPSEVFFFCFLNVLLMYVWNKSNEFEKKPKKKPTSHQVFQTNTLDVKVMRYH